MKDGTGMPNLDVNPVEGSLDQSTCIRVVNCKPGTRVRLGLRNTSVYAESTADFIANDDGVVDTTTQAPVSGDYRDIDPTGLFWSARFDPGHDVSSMWLRLAELDPLHFELRLENGGTVLREPFTRHLVAPAVRREEVRAGRVRGTFFVPANLERGRGVVVLGGSDGGNRFRFFGALLARHGLAVLSLSYFRHDDLPAEMIEIPLEYFREGIAWLQGQPEVAGARVGLVGASRGGEAALLLGATFPEVAAVVAMVPSTLTGGGIGRDLSAMYKPAWTLAGRPFPMIQPAPDEQTIQEFRKAMATGEPFASTPGMLRMLANAGNRIDEVAIPVERTQGPIFIMSAEDDQLWPSTPLSEIAAKRARDRSFPHTFDHVSYRGAGHLACLPPFLPTTSLSSRAEGSPVALAYGGSPSHNAVASAANWQRVREFLQQHVPAASP